MKRLVFATNNPHKLGEVQAILGDKVKILSLTEINCFDDIPETADTLEGNALLKARYIFEKFGVDCFVDDTGLEIPALENAPGVYSARYAGANKDSAANVKKVLTEMQNKSDRRARFRTVVALIIAGKEYLFEGTVEGKIIEQPLGRSGFGYDPIFIPDGCSQTFAEMNPAEKNQISHRALAVDKLKMFIDENVKN
jgi:XTP/dITP diphosphohydrolase